MKYKPMMNGILLPENRRTGNLLNLEKFLEDEKNTNLNDTWCKLNKTVKTKKMLEYVEVYKETHDLSQEEADLLTTFLKDCLDRKKLQRVKDVIYDKDTGTIRDIPALLYVKPTKHFTLKNLDKRVSTLKSLAPKKALVPKGSHGTFRKKETKVVEVDSEEETDV